VQGTTSHKHATMLTLNAMSRADFIENFQMLMGSQDDAPASDFK